MKKMWGKGSFQIILSGILTFLIVWTIFFINGYAPFGDNSLATMDAEYQYIDLFGYLKDILTGDNRAAYTFSKTLGGNSVGIFGYYLSSPFNILILLFEKSQIIEFFHLTISLKLTVAAMFFSLFIKKRFYRELRSEGLCSDTYLNNGLITVILSISYALCQYSISQSSNIMWLDGVYMLPLILLGVYRIVNGEGIWKLALPIGMSILFNWYTGGINCAFAAVWFLFEIIICYTDGDQKFDRYAIKRSAKLLVRFVIGMGVGVMFSSILFLPVVGALRNGPRGELEFRNLLNLSFQGNVLSTINSYSLGAKSGRYNVSLFCGSIALLGCIGDILVKPRRSGERCIRLIVLITAVMMFYWNPLYTVFSLFKSVGSYWSRYSYLGVFCIVFLAADFYLERMRVGMTRKMILATLILGMLMLILNRMLEVRHSFVMICLTVLIMVSTTVFIWCVPKIKFSSNAPTWIRRVTTVIISIIFLLETGCSVTFQMENYHREDVEYIKEYIPEAERIYSSLKDMDDEAYRVNNTVNRNVLGRGIRANYDEALAYGFWGMGGYTSSPDAVTLDFMDRLGYRKNAGCMSVVNTSNIAVDSLLGVKYVTSVYGINGLKVIQSIPMSSCNKMRVYSNPYALPMAFKYNTVVDESKIMLSDENNPFEYVNKLYSVLLGKEVDIFIPFEYTVTSNCGEEIKYDIEIPEGRFAVYGNIPWNTEFQGEINVNDKYKSGYAKWISPTVFYIPTKIGATDCHVTLSVTDPNNSIDIKENAEQFYGVDLEVLKESADILRAGDADNIQIQNGEVSIDVCGDDGESLLISIPYDQGWTVELNGNEITPDTIDGALYSIKLNTGDNHINMKYHVKYSGIGFACSILGLLLCFISYVVDRRRKA